MISECLRIRTYAMDFAGARIFSMKLWAVIRGGLIMGELWKREVDVLSERFDFTNAAGERLAALLDSPTGAPRAYALFAHCFTCGKDIRAARRIAEALTALGIAVLRFDFTGLGSSEGEFANTTFSSNVADLLAAADALRRTKRVPAILIGHSLGGAAVLAAAADVPARS